MQRSEPQKRPAAARKPFDRLRLGTALIRLALVLFRPGVLLKVMDLYNGNYHNYSIKARFLVG
jgi:hypothetical protein